MKFVFPQVNPEETGLSRETARAFAGPKWFDRTGFDFLLGVEKNVA